MVASWWWIVQKELVTEWRSRQVWPSMLLLGMVMVLVFGIELEAAGGTGRSLLGGLLWLAIFFAGWVALDRSFSSETEHGCLDGLLLYPVSPATVYLAKLCWNFISLCMVESVLIPLFAAMARAPLGEHPGRVILLALAGNLGLAAVGTLVSAITHGIRRAERLLVLLTLPLVLPVIVACAEATELSFRPESAASWWHCMQFLMAFAVVFVTAGIVLFEFVIER